LNEESRKAGRKKPDRMYRIYRIWNSGSERHQILPILFILPSYQAVATGSFSSFPAFLIPNLLRNSRLE
jgi:hypothetical protein